MKLNNQQVSALADKIYDQIKKGIDKYNTLLDKSCKFDKWKKDNTDIVDALSRATTYCKIYAELVNITYSYNDFLQVSEIDVNKELKRVFKEGISYKKMPCSKDEIRQDIILDTIECDNLDEVITKLVDKYTK